MKKKSIEGTLLRKIQRTQNLLHSKKEEISSRLRMLDDFLEGSTHNATITKAMLSLSKDADQLRKTVEFLKTKERDSVTIAEALEAIRQQRVYNNDTDSGMSLDRTEAIKKLGARLAELHAEVAKRVAKDKKKLRWIQQNYSAKDVIRPVDTGNGQVSELQSKPPEGASMLLDMPSSESTPSPTKEACSTSKVVASLMVSSEQICTTPVNECLGLIPRPLTSTQPLRIPTQQDDKSDDIPRPLTPVNECLGPIPRPLTSTQPLRVPTQQDDKPDDKQVPGKGEVIEGLSSNLGQVNSPDSGVRVVLIKSSDIIGYSGPGIFNQAHPWPSIHLDRDTMMDRVFDVVRSHLGIMRRGMMRLWVFEETSDGHFLPRVIVHGKNMRAKLSSFGRKTVVLFVQLADKSQRLYTFNHSTQRLVFIKARDLCQGNVIVYGHHVIDCFRSTSHVLQILQKICLFSALCKVQCSVESSPGQTKSIQWTSGSVFKLDLGSFCQHGTILWLTEEERKDSVSECEECCQINVTVNQSSFIEKYNSLEKVSSNNFLSNEVKEQLVHTDSVNQCHEQVSAFSAKSTSDSLSTCTSVEDTMWQVPSEPTCSHMDLTNLYFQRAAALGDYHPNNSHHPHLLTHPFGDHPVLPQAQFIIPVQPHFSLAAFPVVGVEPAFVAPSDHLYWVDPTLGQPSPVCATGGSLEHDSVCGEQTYTMPESNYYIPEGVLDCPIQEENVSSDVNGNERGGMEEGLVSAFENCSLLTLHAEKESEDSKYEERSCLSPPRVVMPVSPSQKSSQKTPHVLLNVNALEFIPGSSWKNRAVTVSDCSHFDSHITNNSPTKVQTSAVEDPQTPQEQEVRQNTASTSASTQDSEIGEKSEKCMEATKHNESTGDKHAKTEQPSGAQAIQSPQGEDNPGKSHEVSRQNSRGKRDGKELHPERSQKSELRDGSAFVNVSRSRASSFPTRPRGLSNSKHADKKNQTYSSNRSEVYHQRTNNFHFPRMVQTHKPAQHRAFPRSDRPPPQRQGWNNLDHNSRQHQGWNRDDRLSGYASERFSFPQNRGVDSRSRVQPAPTRTVHGSEREAGSVTKSESFCGNPRNTCDATHRLGRTRKDAAIPAGRSGPAAGQQFVSFTRTDRIYQLPRFAHLQHHKLSGGSASRYNRCARYSQADDNIEARPLGHYSHDEPKQDRSQLEPSRNTSTGEDLGATSSRPLSGAEKDKSSTPVQLNPTNLTGTRKGFIRYVGPPANSRPVP